MHFWIIFWISSDASGQWSDPKNDFLVFKKSMSSTLCNITIHNLVPFYSPDLAHFVFYLVILSRCLPMRMYIGSQGILLRSPEYSQPKATLPSNQPFSVFIILHTPPYSYTITWTHALGARREGKQRKNRLLCHILFTTVLLNGKLTLSSSFSLTKPN